MIYLKNGLEPLNLAYDDEIVQEANGLYQLSFKFPLVDALWASLKTEAFLVADDVHGEQEFFIFEVAKKDYFIEVYANQVASLLHHYSLSAIGVNRVPGQTVMQALAGGMVRSSPFSFFSDVSSRHTLNLSNLSVMDALAKNKHSIMGQWGGDLIRDKYRVSLLQQGGSENESLFMYKKNIRSIAGVESIKGLKTRLHLRKVNEEKQAISVTVDSPLIGKYSQIYEGTIEVQDQDVVSAEDLRRYGERYFATHLCDIVEESFDIDVEGLPDVAVRLFDTVTVFDERYGLDVRRKITRYVYSPMRGRLKSIGFGKVQTNLGDKMAAIASEVSEQDKAGLEDDFERKLQKEVENMNRVVEREREERLSALNDGIEQVKAKSEEVKATILSEIEGKIAESRQEPYDLAQSARQLAEEARAAAATAKESALARVDEVARTARSVEESVARLREDMGSEVNRLIASSGHSSELEERIQRVENGETSIRQEYSQLRASLDSQTGMVAALNRQTASIETGLSGLQTRLERVQVGGRNYIRNSAAFSGTGWDANQWEGNYTGVWRKEQDRVLNLPVAHHVRGDKSTPIHIMDVSVGETYTFSAYVKKESVGTVYLYLYDNVEEDARTDVGREIRKDNVGDNWQRLSTTFRVTRAGKLKIRFAIVASDRGGFSVSAFHLEKGTIPTDWSPHPEDGNGQTETVRQELATFRQTNSQQLAELTQRVERTDGSLSEAKSRFDQTAQGLRTEVQALQSYVNEDGSRTQSLQEYVRTETAKKTDQLRSEIGQGYATKNQLTETVAGMERRIESVQTGAATLMDTKVARYAQTVDRNLASLTQQLGDKVAMSTFNQGLDRIQQSVTALSGEALKHSEVTITENGVTLGANKTIGANTLSSILTTSPESIQAITDKMVITPHQHNLFPWKEGRVVTDKHEQITGWRNLSLKEGDELLAKFDIHCTNKRGGAFVGIRLYLKYEDDTTAGLTIVVPEAELTTVRKMETRSLVFPRLPKRVKQVAFGLYSSFATTTFYSADVRVKSSAELIVDGSITGRQIKAGAIETGHLKAGSVTAAHIQGDAIEGRHLKVDDAFLNKLTATDALVNKLTANDVFATAVQAVTIDASQVTSGLLRAKNGASAFDLNNGAINFYTNHAALRRKIAEYPTQFVKFETGNYRVNGTNLPMGVTVIGSNRGKLERGIRTDSENTNNGEFAGIRIWNGFHSNGEFADSIDLVGDEISLMHKAYDDDPRNATQRGWKVKSYGDGTTVSIFPFGNYGTSYIMANDIRLLLGDGTYKSLRGILTNLNAMWAHFGNGMTPAMVKNKTNRDVNLTLANIKI